MHLYYGINAPVIPDTSFVRILCCIKAFKACSCSIATALSVKGSNSNGGLTEDNVG